MKSDIVKEILAGKIFIYPTDTIYGLGCDATNQKAVDAIKKLKGRDREKPLSVIAPNFKWIEENFEYNYDLTKYLPGPYTLLLKKKNLSFLEHISNNDRIGVRIPANSFTLEIQNSGVPFVTTSVNLSGEPFILDIQEIRPEIRKNVDYIIPAVTGEKLSGIPSTLILDGKPLERK